jgi:diguanylate cyclase (GGDEF)-like protein
VNPAAVLVYWPIVAVWAAVLGTVIYFYIRNPRAFGTTRLLLAVLAIDTIGNIVENIYFGVYFGAQYGYFPPVTLSVLGRPILLLVPKLLNLASASLVLTILLLRWLPAAVRERQTAERTAEVLREIATRDGMTGLFNRDQFLTLGEAEWARSRRYGRPLSMLMLDIDQFKSVNDQHGHDVGDRVITQIAKICRDCTREVDIAARLGGEEFAILMPETELSDARLLAERLRKTVCGSKILVDHTQLQITVSIGVGQAVDLDNFSALIKATDRGLYDAKRSGRNRVCYLRRDLNVRPTIDTVIPCSSHPAAGLAGLTGDALTAQSGR